MKPKVYGIRNCDTMNKALAWLDERAVAYEFHDYKKRGIGTPKLKEWQQNPSAIRRPIVEQGAKLLVGFDPAEFDAAF